MKYRKLGIIVLLILEANILSSAYCSNLHYEKIKKKVSSTIEAIECLIRRGYEGYTVDEARILLKENFNDIKREMIFLQPGEREKIEDQLKEIFEKYYCILNLYQTRINRREEIIKKDAILKGLDETIWEKINESNAHFSIAFSDTKGNAKDLIIAAVRGESKWDNLDLAGISVFFANNHVNFFNPQKIVVRPQLKDFVIGLSNLQDSPEFLTRWAKVVSIAPFLDLSELKNNKTGNIILEAVQLAHSSSRIPPEILISLKKAVGIK